jgi:hypothetical protein
MDAPSADVRVYVYVCVCVCVLVVADELFSPQGASHRAIA